MTDKTMTEALTQYFDRSASGLGRMRDALQSEIRDLPPAAHNVANMVRPFMPGVGSMDSVSLGGEAGRHWRDGDYGKSLVKFSDSLVAPMDDAYWFLPGAGLVRKPL